MGAGSMSMRHFVGSDRKFGDVRSHCIVRHFEIDSGAAGAPRIAFLQLESVNVVDEIAAPDQVRQRLAFGAEIVLLAAEAIPENVIAIEDEVRAAHEIEHDRGVGDHKQTNDLIRRTVEMLTPGIDRRRKYAAFLPFEGLLLLSSVHTVLAPRPDSTTTSSSNMYFSGEVWPAGGISIT